MVFLHPIRCEFCHSRFWRVILSPPTGGKQRKSDRVKVISTKVPGEKPANVDTPLAEETT